MNNRIGLWEVDCRELSEDGKTLKFRHRVEPLTAKLNELYSLAKRCELTTVFTICCSGRMPQNEDRKDFLFVPLQGNESGWESQVSDYPLIYLAKVACGDPRLNFECRAFDVFHGNRNAERLLFLLDISTWIVFGNGFELCTASSVEGILGAGYRVQLITDVLAQSAGGYGDFGTEKSKARVVEELRAKGVETLLLRELILQLS
jgi:nicotinamidase-related amidase